MRDAGSPEEFEADWREALRTGAPRWLVYPEAQAPDQVALAEWVKAQQVLTALRRHGVTSGPVLEYGCGAAGMSIFLGRCGYATVAMDLSPAALTVAALNQRLHDPTGHPLRRVVGDARALPFAPGAFAAVMSYGLLEHFAEPGLSALLRESGRALLPGGVFIADVVPGRLNARTFGLTASFLASAAAHALRGRWRAIPDLYRAYYHHYFESSLGPDAWASLLARAGLAGVDVRVCRPFPPLAVSGAAERVYTELMRRCLPLWRRFDASRSPLARAWGWMYLCTAVKPRPPVADE